MTPLQFAVAECANHQPDGSCAGVMINPDLSMSRASPKPRCLLAEGTRCRYFETCVAPMADWVTDPKRAASLQAAVAEYRRVTKQGEDLRRQCPACGQPMQKGRRYCPACAADRRKDSHRRHNTHRRQGEVMLTTEVQKNAPKSPMIPGGISTFSKPDGRWPPPSKRPNFCRQQPPGGVLMKPLIAIDPGASGGIAWRDAEGVVHAAPMPDGMTAQVDFLRSLAAGLPGAEAVIEKVGYWMPGDHPNSATKFARHCGHLEAALYALGVPFVAVAPGVWMKKLGSLPQDKQARKRTIKEEMQRRFPALSVTLSTADALALFTVQSKESSP